MKTFLPRTLADMQPCENAKLSNEFEYIPIRGGAFRIHIHNPTPYDQDVYLFDNIDHQPCPLLHFNASHIALMVQAEPHLASPVRFQTPKGNVAEPQVVTLLKLYQRQPGRPLNPPIVSVPVHYAGLRAELDSQPSAQILTPVPGSPPLSSTGSHSISTPSFINTCRQV